MALEFVDHFLWNVNPLFSVNAYGIFQMSKGASGQPTDRNSNFVAGARTFLYITDHFHLINELTYQAVFQGHADTAAAPGTPQEWKFAIMPTIVPSGERSPWARPHLRFIYTLAHFNEGAREASVLGTLSNPYFRNFGPREWGHYLGVRSEWWF
jgi:maltoporin